MCRGAFIFGSARIVVNGDLSDTAEGIKPQTGT